MLHHIGRLLTENGFRVPNGNSKMLTGQILIK